jgi:esterase
MLTRNDSRDWEGPVDLYAREFGGDASPPIVLLHGLLGSSRNWVSAGRLLAEHRRVIALDLRNHGESPHSEGMDYPSLARDVVAWIDVMQVPAVHLVGHSMGGKVAMLLACEYPELVRSLTIVDIADKAYPPHLEDAFCAMRAIDPGNFHRLLEAEQAMIPYGLEESLRRFLVTNLRRNPQGTFDWQIHLEAIHRALPELAARSIQFHHRYEGPVQLIRGEQSDFVEPRDVESMKGPFPSITEVYIRDAGHNVHIDQKERFVEALVAAIGGETFPESTS